MFYTAVRDDMRNEKNVRRRKMIEIIYGIFVTLVGVYVGEIVIRRLIDVYIEIKDKLSK